MFYAQSTNVLKNDKRGTLFTSVCRDCIEKIFEYLDLNDLAVTGQVCRLFKEVAENIFIRKFNRHCNLVEDNRRGSKSVKLNKIENVLKTFGAELRSLEASSIDGWQSDKPNDQSVLNCIKKYFCDSNENPNIEKELKIRDFHFDDSMVENVSLLFGQLSKLTITRCKLLDGTDQLFANCGNLTKLKLDFVHTNPAVEFEYSGRRRKFNKIRTSESLDPCFNHHFPKLTSFTMKSISTAAAADLDNFLSKNPQLKILKIIQCPQFNDVLQSLARHVPNIEKLNIPTKYIKRKTDLVGLKQLQKLEINFGHGGGTNAFTALRQMATSNVALEILKLVDFHLTDELIKTLVKFKALNQLVLVVGNFPDDKFQTLSEHLAETRISVVQNY